MRNKKYYIIYLLLFFTAANQLLIAQLDTRKRDSLVALLNTNQSDTARFYTYVRLVDLISEYDNKQAFKYAQIIDSLAKKINTKETDSHACYAMAISYYKLDDYTTGLKLFFDALTLAEETNNKRMQHRSLNNIGNIYIQLEQIQLSLDYFLKAVNIAEQLKDTIGLAKYYVNVGTCYKHLNKKEISSEYYFKALKAFSAAGYKRGIMQAYLNISTLYASENNLVDCEQYMIKALKMAKEVKDNNSISLLYANLGTLALINKQPGLVLQNADSSYYYAVLANSIRRKIEVYKLKAQAYSTKNDYKNAYDYFLKYASVNDSLTKADNTEKISNAEQKYLFAQKEKEIEILKRDSAIAELQNEKSKFYITILVLLVLLVGVVSVMFFNRYRSKTKDNKMLQQQKEIIEQKQKEILDSIHYAKRIQDSLLTSEKYIDKELKRFRK